MSMRVILGCIKHADEDYSLIENNDTIAVGISGGKDSMVLLASLCLYKKFSKKTYSIIAINIEMGFSNMDMSPIKEYCKQNNIEFHIEPSEPLIYDVLKLNANEEGKLPCSICSKMKKAAMMKAAHKYNCNKVAFAHHVDDAIETLLLNMTHGGRIATFSPKMQLSRENITFIRPLCYCEEKYIIKTQEENNIPIVNSTCPNNKHTEREETKELLKKYYHKYPESKQNFINMLSNTSKFDLWKKNNEDEKEWVKNEIKMFDEQHNKVFIKDFFTTLDKYGNLAGTLSYTIKDNELIIDNLFVKKENRNEGKGLELLNKALELNYEIATILLYDYQNIEFFLNNKFTIVSRIKINDHTSKYLLARQKNIK